MLKQEYDKAMGYTSSDAEYDNAKEVYMYGPWVNNTDFLDEWSHASIRTKETLISMAETAGAYRNTADVQKGVVKELADELIKLGAEGKVLSVMGRKYVVERKLLNGDKLANGEVDYLLWLIANDGEKDNTNNKKQ